MEFIGENCCFGISHFSARRLVFFLKEQEMFLRAEIGRSIHVSQLSMAHSLFHTEEFGWLGPESSGFMYRSHC